MDLLGLVKIGRRAVLEDGSRKALETERSRKAELARDFARKPERRRALLQAAVTKPREVGRVAVQRMAAILKAFDHSRRTGTPLSRIFKVK